MPNHPSDAAWRVLRDAIESGYLTLHKDAQGEIREAHFEGDDEQFKAICELSSLSVLNCNAASVTDGAFQNVDRLTNLVRLSFINTPITGEAFGVLKNLPRLKSVNCNPQQFPAKAADALAGCLGVSTLRCSISAFGNPEAEVLLQLPRLEELSFSQCESISDGCCSRIDRSQVARLSLSYTDCGDATCEDLAGSSRLVSLDLSGTKITGAGIELLGQIPRLEELLISRTELNSKDVCRLGECPSLRDLFLMETNVDDDVVDYLLSLPNLRILDVSSTRISDEGIRGLKSREWEQFDYD